MIFTQVCFGEWKWIKEKEGIACLYGYLSLGEGCLHSNGVLIEKTSTLIKKSSCGLADDPVGKYTCTEHLRFQVQMPWSNYNNNKQTYKQINKHNFNICVLRALTKRQGVKTEDIAENSREPVGKKIQGCCKISHLCGGTFPHMPTPGNKHT